MPVVVPSAISDAMISFKGKFTNAILRILEVLLVLCDAAETEICMA